jgi:hypothetical protein
MPYSTDKSAVDILFGAGNTSESHRSIACTRCTVAHVHALSDSIAPRFDG